MIIKRKNKIVSGTKDINQVGLFLTIITTLIFSWYYLFNLTIEISAEGSSNFVLMSLSFLHYFVLVLAVITIYILFLLGLLNSKIHKTIKYRISIAKDNLSNFLFNWWFIVLLNSIMTLLITAIYENLADYSLLVFSILVLFTLGLLYIAFGKNIHFMKIFFSSKIIYVVAILLVGFYLYILIVSTAFASISVSTDKIIYTTNDVVLLSVEENGYIFLPMIESITCNQRDTLFNRNEGIEGIKSAYKLNLSNYSKSELGSLYISVEYKTEVFGIVRKKFYQVKVAL